MSLSLNNTAVVIFLQELKARPMDWRCSHCGRLLARARLVTGSYVQVRCPKCGHMNSVDDEAGMIPPGEQNGKIST